MKKVFLFIVVLWLATTCMAQESAWKEFNDFHAAVSKVLHPVMNGNIKPVKDSSRVLLAKAKVWQASNVPADINAGVFKTNVAELVNECSALNEAVKAKKTDTELKTLAVKVHESFHSLLSACHLKD